MNPNTLTQQRASSNYQFAKWFLVTAGLFLLLQTAFTFLFKTPSVKLPFHDTYFVFSHSWLLMLLSAQMAFIAVIYFMFGYMNRRLHRGLSLVHFFITILSFCILGFGLWKVSFFTISDSENVNEVLFDYKLLKRYLASSGFVLLFAQIIFVINCLFALLQFKRLR
jgi:heme/copper-type cytochrome/quinol oxidase subunit 1